MQTLFPRSGSTYTTAAPLAALLLAAVIPAAWAQQDTGAMAHSRLDPETLSGAAYYDEARFPQIGRSAFHPDSRLPAPVRAVLMVDAREGALLHARYRIRYHLAPGAQEDDAPVAEVEVVRLNMGPAVRTDLIEQDPALPVAPADAFGTGPHVSYRFLMGPIQGMEAAIWNVERRELVEAEVKDLRCLDMPCLALMPGEGPGGDWQSIPAALPELPFDRGGVADPAAAAILAFLLDASGEDAGTPLPRGETHRFEFVISRNTFGQDDASLGLGRDAVVLDDEIGTQWLRWRAAGGAEPDASRLLLPR